MDEPLHRLLSDIESKKIVVPEFQREYVWNRILAKNLFTSLYKEYPVGSLLLWIVKKSKAPPIKKIRYDEKDDNEIRLILDGQQRLTALYLILKGEVPPYYDLKDIKKYDPRELYFNLITEEFQYYQKTRMKDDPSWKKVTWLFSAKQGEIEKIANHVQEKLGQGAGMRVLSNYLKLISISKRDFTMQKIPEDVNELQAILIFDLVNTQGTRLTAEELALAHIQNSWKNARRELKKYIEHASDMNFHFNLAFLVRCLTAVVQKSGRPETIHNAKEADLIIGWEKVKRSLDYLIHFLPREAYIHSTSDLISSSTLVPLVAYLAKNNYRFDNESRRKGLYWFYLATLRSWYSTSPESRLNSDVRTVSLNNDPFPMLVDEILKTYRVEIEPRDLERVRITNTGIGRVVLIVAKHNQARDWFLGTRIVGGGEGKYSIEYHHIFPSSILYKNGFEPKKDYDIVNEIANKAFITAKTNREIRNSYPAKYLPEVEKSHPNALESQFMPLDPNLWEIKNYHKFLAERRRIIAKAINVFLIEVSQPLKNKVDIQSIIERDEGQHLEFKSTLRVDTEGKGLGAKVIEEQALKTMAAFMNQDDGGSLIIGVDDDKNIVGLERDYATLPKSNRDGFLLHFSQIVSNSLGKEFERNFDVDFFSVNGHDVALVKVTKGYKFVSLNGQNYVRQRNKTMPLSPSDAAEYIRRVWN